MPIIVPEGDCSLFDRLQESGAAVLTEEAAERQDIRPARLGILNLMPAATMEATEAQWLRYMSRTPLQIEPVLVKFDNDVREMEGSSRSSLLCRYTPFSAVAEVGLDGLIVTGDNLELGSNASTSQPSLMPFADISYAKQLGEVIDWSRENVRSTIYSCLASHFALKHLFDIDRQIVQPKVFGVFEHEVMPGATASYVDGLDDNIRAPHSRWGDVPAAALLGNAAIELLANSDEAGWLLAASANQTGGSDLFIQGHPEYDKFDLDREYQRDRDFGQAAPRHYYDAKGRPVLSWANDARALHSNWINEIYRHFSQESDPAFVD